ncbi:SAM-dependent methyltransferase [Salinifilum aidingensis]
MTSEPVDPSALPEVDTSTPNIARMYDHLLGGSANLPVDREAVAQLLAAFPGNRAWVQINRAFLLRAVRALCDRGIDQFLDLGSGIPTEGNVHDIAAAADPAARVAYVDIDPTAVAHARHLLQDASHVTVTRADLREPRSVLQAPGVSGLLDFTRPVAVLAVAVLDIVEADPTALLATYRAACAPGSALVVSHSADLELTDAERDGAQQVFSRTSTPQLHLRDRDEIAALFTDYTLLEPGVVPSAAWRPDAPVSDAQARRSNSYAAVGVLQ